MKLRRRRKATEAAAPAPAHPNKPPWADLLDPEERPNREDLAADHNVFLDTMLSPPGMPRWLRGKRRVRDKIS